MESVQLAPQVARDLETHMNGVRLEIFSGVVPEEKLGRVAEITGEPVEGCQITVEIEGSLASLQFAKPGGGTRRVPISPLHATEVMGAPRRRSKVLVDVGKGILLDECHSAGTITAIPRCEVGDSFLQLVKGGVAQSKGAP